MSAPRAAGDRAAPGVDALRKAGLQRALLAAVAALVLTASLALVGEDETVPEPPAASPAAVAVPAVAETHTAEPPADVAAAPAESSSGAVAQASDAVPAGGDGAPLPAPAEPAPASGSAEAAVAQGGASAAAPPATPAPSAAVQASPPAAETPPAPGAAAPLPPAAPARLHTEPPPGPGYLIQLGVFLDTGNAEGMRRELERKGYPAHLQARVVLGPYPDRQSALAEQEKIRRERKLDGMILPPRK
ncbi:SPOR domain-containing protein [Azoarcus sp. DN11]|uniref:SPOR domain-containing protein n=1 Tax=Azoarcus sp. DN11 TaxID=356837 RepID=UPI000EB49155|nr:SPOR domain-containing protein [Azoarcus sp. DN11]AYH45723.1 hypothetical protein CDA09_20450 [Azoarcus sp. DN11]